MKLNKIIDDYVVSDQIQTEDIAIIKNKGFKTIFCKKSVNSEAGFEFSDKFHVEWYNNLIFHQ